MAGFRFGILALMVLVMWGAAVHGQPASTAPAASAPAAMCTISGKVVDVETGAGVKGIQLIQFALGESGVMEPVQVTSGEGGEFQTKARRGTTTILQLQRNVSGSYLLDSEWLSANYQEPFNKKVEKDVRGVVVKVKTLPVLKLTGKVLDADDRPVKGALVYFSPEVPGAATDASGSFTLEAFPKTRDTTLCAMTEGKKLAGLLDVKAGAKAATIRVFPTVTFQGEVKATDGTAADDLKLCMALRINGGNLWATRVEPVTDATGKFVAAGLVPGATYFTFWGGATHLENRDYANERRTIRLAELKEGEPIRFTAKKFTNTLIGKIFSEKGEAIAGALVQAASWELVARDAVAVNAEAGVRTDKTGEFVMSRLAAGEVKLRVSAAGYKTTVLRAPTDEVDFKIVLKPATTPCAANVSVVYEDGKPAADVPVFSWIVWYPANGRPMGEKKNATTDAAGKAAVVVPTVSSDNSTAILIWCDREGFELALADVRPGEETDVRLVLRKITEGQSGFVVTREGAPIAGAQVQLTDITPVPGDTPSSAMPLMHEGIESPIVMKVTTNEQGRFEFPRMSKRCWIHFRIAARGYAGLSGAFNGVDLTTKPLFKMTPEVVR